MGLTDAHFRLYDQSKWLSDEIPKATFSANNENPRNRCGRHFRLSTDYLHSREVPKIWIVKLHQFTNYKSWWNLINWWEFLYRAHSSYRKYILRNVKPFLFSFEWLLLNISTSGSPYKCAISLSEFKFPNTKAPRNGIFAASSDWYAKQVELHG